MPVLTIGILFNPHSSVYFSGSLTKQYRFALALIAICLLGKTARDFEILLPRWRYDNHPFASVTEMIFNDGCDRYSNTDS